MSLRMAPSTLVIGSSNTNMVIKAERLPAPEKLSRRQIFMTAERKGSNQAVAAAKIGGKLIFIAKVGSDILGKQPLQLLEEEGINT